MMNLAQRVSFLGLTLVILLTGSAAADTLNVFRDGYIEDTNREQNVFLDGTPDHIGDDAYLLAGRTVHSGEVSPGAQFDDKWPGPQLVINVDTQTVSSVSITNPQGDTPFIAPAQIDLVATTTGTVIISKVQFYNGTSLIATDTTAPYTLNWTNVRAGNYTITAKAIRTDKSVDISSPVVIVVDNPPFPAVKLTAPADNAVFVPDSTIHLGATASVKDSTITKVEFYNGSIRLATDTTAPYEFIWSNVAEGTYSLWAKAYNAAGGAANSIRNTVNVTTAVMPTIRLTSPVYKSSFFAPSEVTLKAAASVTHGTIDKVEFYNGTQLLATDMEAPYSYIWRNVPEGLHHLRAKAYNGPLVRTSGTVEMTYKPNPPFPAVKLTMPVDNAVFLPDSTIHLIAAASVADSTVAKVEFYNGSVRLATVTTAPYEFVWNNVPAGTYSLWAKAYNLVGEAANSIRNTVNVTTADMPTVRLTSPVYKSSFTAPSAVILKAAASVTRGTIDKVEFYNGTQLLATDNTAPYSYVWRNVPEGLHHLRAKAYNGPLVRTSGTIKMTYNHIAPKAFLTADYHATLQEMLKTHLNYFLSPQVITASGLPLGAYKEGQRARYNYSNSAEWGYAMQAWIMAADTNMITVDDAAARMEKALMTMQTLQNNSQQSYSNLFYQYYYVTDANGNDLVNPVHDVVTHIPSIDNALLYTSLNIVQGWAKANQITTVETLANQIKNRMQFRIYLQPDKLFMVHYVDASNGQMSVSKCDGYSDEGGLMAWVSYISGAVTLDEFKQLIDSQMRLSRTWDGITVMEAQWFNPMFAWGVRSWAGIPIATWESGFYNRYGESLVNAVKAHLLFGQQVLGMYYPAFSDAMTQVGGVGRYTPPNISNTIHTEVPSDAVVHAFFVPFVVGPDLPATTINSLMIKIRDLKTDTAGYYHNGQDSHKPFGFELTTSPRRNDAAYAGMESRYIYETISTSYTAMSLYQGLNINDGKPTFYHYAAQVAGYEDKIKNGLEFLYSPKVRHVPFDYPTIQAAINAAQSGDTIKVAAGTYTEAIVLNKSGITLQAEPGKTILQNSSAPAIVAQNLFGPVAKIIGFTILDGGIQCAGTVKALMIENNKFLSDGVYLMNGASANILGNTFQDGPTATAIYSEGNNTVNILSNKISNFRRGLGGGINLRNTTALIEKNIFVNNWDGAINLSANSTAQINQNQIYSNGAWNLSSGLNITDSTVTLRNNIIVANSVSSLGASGGIWAKNSTVTLYNNVFSRNSGKIAAHLSAENSNIILRNNILNNLTANPQMVFTGLGVKDLFFNNLWPTAIVTGATVNATNISLDPRFVNANNDFHLQTDSPCINAGDQAVEFNDLDGSRNDMGVYGGPNSL